MLKAAFLPEQENLALQQELFKHYDSYEYLTTINNLCFTLKINYEKTMHLAETVMLVVNKVLLDNVFRHVATKNADTLVHQLQCRTFIHDVYVNPFYVSQILEYAYIQDEDSRFEYENEVKRYLLNIVSWIYSNPTSRLGEVLLRVFECLNNHLNYLNISFYKFELAERRKPILLYTEKQDAFNSY